MNRCRCGRCRYAVWDYETYYGTTRADWFVADCSKGLDGENGGEDCEEYAEEDRDDG